MCEIDGNPQQHLTSAAIIGQDGSIWAQSSSFPKFKPKEITGIMKDFDEPGYLAPTGLHLGGTKYMVIQGELNAVIRGKKGSGGITIKKTGQALVFGIYDEPVTPGQCNMIVERLGDYLVEQGLQLNWLRVGRLYLYIVSILPWVFNFYFLIRLLAGAKTGICLGQ